MKLKFIPISAVLFLAVSYSAWTVSAPLEIQYRAWSASESEKPYIQGDFILFRYKPSSKAKKVFLAFEHEQYRKFRIFERNEQGVFVLILPAPANRMEIRYRLIVDGLWTVDPSTQIETDRNGIRVSRLLLETDMMRPIPGYKYLSDNRIQFTFSGKEGQRIAIVGDFNQWDPFINPLRESDLYPGLFTTTLILPPGIHYYRYVVNGQTINDPENPSSARNGWGEPVSVLKP